MKKLFLYLILACFTTSADAQFARLLSKKKNKSENTNSQTTKQYSFSPPLGIEWPNDIPLIAKIGSNVGNRGIRGDARSKGHWSTGDFWPDNKDATRFLEKAVQENDVEKVEKLLKAGASAFVSYEMIEKKQYEILDAMYRDNPKLIRYSQLLHYACAKSDTTMIDFLIQRNASLDLYGYYITKDKLGDYTVLCRWNGDDKYQNTPADVALSYGNVNNLYFIIHKHHKYPTIYGISKYLYKLLEWSKWSEKTGRYTNVEFLTKVLTGNSLGFIGNDVDYTISDVMNFGYHKYEKKGDKMFPKTYYMINVLISKIAECRKQNKEWGKEYIDLLNLMLEKGADVNIEEDNGAYHRYIQSTIGMGSLEHYTNTTPMTIAVKSKNMLDIIQLLRSKGAPMTTEVNGQRVSVLQIPGALDEYKEYFMLEGK